MSTPTEHNMTRDELTAIVKRSTADTLIAARFRQALGIRPLAHAHGGQTHDRTHSRKYRGIRALMRQRVGVRL